MIIYSVVSRKHCFLTVLSFITWDTYSLTASVQSMLPEPWEEGCYIHVLFGNEYNLLLPDELFLLNIPIGLCGEFVPLKEIWSSHSSLYNCGISCHLFPESLRKTQSLVWDSNFPLLCVSSLGCLDVLFQPPSDQCTVFSFEEDLNEHWFSDSHFFFHGYKQF